MNTNRKNSLKPLIVNILLPFIFVISLIISAHCMKAYANQAIDDTGVPRKEKSLEDNTGNKAIEEAETKETGDIDEIPDVTPETETVSTDKLNSLSSNWVWPTSNHTLKSDWPCYSDKSYHGGTDFPIALNSPVYSTCYGKVVDIQSLTNSYGKHIKIQATVNGSIVYIRYCHLNGFNVSVGDTVKAGQQIGISGSTGNSTGPHLHYEVRNANDYRGYASSPNLNPRNYLPGTSYRYENDPYPPGKQTISDGDYHIVSAINNSKVMAVTSDSMDSQANILLWISLNAPQSVFHVQYCNDGYYEIWSTNSGMSLDVAVGTNEEAPNLQQYTRNGTDAQRWVIEDCGDGQYYNIISKCNGKCIDISGGLDEDGRNIQVYGKNGTSAQKWKFVPWTNPLQEEEPPVIEPEETKRFKGHIYERYGYAMTWEKAKQYCEEKGGHLVTITSQEENDFVKGLASEAWIGAGDKEEEGEFHWVNGEAFGYRNWGPGEPNNADENENAVEIVSSGQWNDNKNETLLPFICEYEPSGPDKSGRYQGHIYESYGWAMTWDEAREYCESKGGHLAAITSEEENKFIHELIPEGWIGAYEAEESGKYEWISGEIFHYSNWGDGEPNNANGNESVAEINGAGQWNDYNSNNLLPFVCEYEAGDPVKTENFQNASYELYDFAMTWEEAKAFCESKGGHLATITSEKENEFIGNLLPDSCSYWIGGADKETEGTFAWVTGEEFDYTNWNEGEPNDADGAEDAIEIYKNGKWNDRSEDSLCFVICEYDPVIRECRITKHPDNIERKIGETATFSIIAEGEGLTYQWQYKEKGSSTWNKCGLTGAKTANLQVPATIGRNGYSYRCVVKDSYGNIVNSNGALLTVNESFVITKHPQDASAAIGKTAKFSVTATGTGLTYQWQYQEAGSSTWNKCGLSGAYTNTVSVPVTAGRNGYSYHCIVKNASGQTKTSNAAKLTIPTGADTLSITKHPVSKTAAVGKTVTFNVTATGKGLTYQWQYRPAGSSTWSKCGLEGAKTDTVSVPVVNGRNGTSYRCVVTDSTGACLNSNAATLTLQEDLEITKHPSSVTAASGKTVYFSVEAAGVGLTYQWQYQEPGKTAWNKCGLEGAKTDTVTVVVTSARNGYGYRCVVTDADGVMAQSSKATLTVSTGNGAKTSLIPDAVKDIRDTIEDVVDGVTRDTENKPKDETDVKEEAGSTENRKEAEEGNSDDEEKDTEENVTDVTNGQAPDAGTENLPAESDTDEEGKGQNTEGTVDTGENEAYPDQDLTDTAPADENEETSTVSYEDEDADSQETYTIHSETEVESNVKEEDDTAEDADASDTGEETVDPITITVQPESVEVEEGQQAILHVEAEGEGLSYQWQYRSSDQKEWSDVTEDALKDLGFTFSVVKDDNLTITTDPSMDSLVFRCIISDEHGQNCISDEVIVNVMSQETTEAVDG